MDSQKTPQAMYDEVVEAIVEAVPGLCMSDGKHEIDGNICKFCGLSRTRRRACKKAPKVRPITLEDVLRAMQGKVSNSIGISMNGDFLDCDNDMNNLHEVGASWTLGKDLAWHLKYKPETISFLHSLLLHNDYRN